MMMKTMSAFKIFAGLGFIFCFLLLLVAFSLQYFIHLDPCLLCVLERYTFMVIMLIFLLSFIHNPVYLGRIIYISCITIFGLLGIVLSGKQIWLQHLPADQVPNCSAGLERMLQYQPILQVLKTALTAAGECAKVDFTLFGLSLASYSFITFIIIVLYSIFYCPLNKQRRT
jgi:disulfide bond formation protein DsbB